MGRFEQVGAAMDKAERELLLAENALLAARQARPTREEALRITLAEFGVTDESVEGYAAAVRALHDKKNSKELIRRYNWLVKQFYEGTISLPILQDGFGRIFLEEDHIRVLSATFQYSVTLLQVLLAAVWDMTKGPLPVDPNARRQIEAYRQNGFGRVSDWSVHMKKIAELEAALPALKDARDKARADLEMLQGEVNARVASRR